MILGQWTPLVYDFQRILGVDLLDAWRARSWEWFEPLVSGLLSTPDSMLRFSLQPSKEG
jgi:hypothetical protein